MIPLIIDLAMIEADLLEAYDRVDEMIAAVTKHGDRLGLASDLLAARTALMDARYTLDEFKSA